MFTPWESDRRNLSGDCIAFKVPTSSSFPSPVRRRKFYLRQTHFKCVSRPFGLFCFPHIEVSPKTCSPKRENSRRHLTMDSLSSKETFSLNVSFRYFSVTFDPSPITVKREHRQERSLLPHFQHQGNLILEKGKGKAALLEAASLGAPRPPSDWERRCSCGGGGRI